MGKIFILREFIWLIGPPTALGTKIISLEVCWFCFASLFLCFDFDEKKKTIMTIIIIIGNEPIENGRVCYNDLVARLREVAIEEGGFYLPETFYLIDLSLLDEGFLSFLFTPFFFFSFSFSIFLNLHLLKYYRGAQHQGGGKILGQPPRPR